MPKNKSENTPAKAPTKAKEKKTAGEAAKTTKTSVHIKTEWDFSKIYKGITDPQLEKDVVLIDKTYTEFAKKYSGAAKKYTTEVKALKTALDDWSLLIEKTGVFKPLWYLHLLQDIDTENNKIKALFNTYHERLVKSSNQVMFFNLELAKITPDNQKKFLKDASLAQYYTFLKEIFENAKYNLSEAEEKLLSIKHAPSHSMWVDAQKKLLTSQMVKHKGKLIPITEASAIKGDLPIKERRALHAEISKKYREISFLAEAELNAVITNKRTTDELRGFTKPYEATVLSYQNSIASVESLVEAVTKRFPDSQRFFKLKAKVLGLPKLTLAEIGTSMAKSAKKYTLDEGVQIIYDAFSKIKPEFAEMFMNFLKEGRFDIYPKKGKRNGAYCSSGTGVPTYILLNHVDDGNSVSTMAHEMGHAIHFELSKSQPALYSDFSISIAEVASTFFENVLFDYQYNRAESKKEKLNMLLERIQDDVFTTHAQISFFKFEIDLHTKIKEKGMLSSDEIAETLVKNRKAFLGPAFEFSPDDGYAYVSVPHFRYFFYVYAYAYGQLIANSLYAEYKRNPAFLEKIEYFLSAGSSKRPDDVFKDIGIDVTKPEFFEKGLDEIAAKIKMAEKLFGEASKGKK